MSGLTAAEVVLAAGSEELPMGPAVEGAVVEVAVVGGV